MNSFIFKIALPFVAVISFLISIPTWVRGFFKEEAHKNDIENAAKNNAIAMRPNKSRADLLKWLRKVSK